MGRRTLLLIASILVAALGTALIWLYVQGADTRAQDGEAQVQVVVSANSVPAGTPAGEVRSVVRSLPQSVVSALGPGLISDPNKIQGFAKTDIVAGMPLLQGQFASGLAPPTPLVAFDPTKLAMQVTLPDPQRLAGLLQPGSLIRVYATQETAQEKGRDLRQTGVLLPRVKVLASGPVTPAEGSGGGTGKGQVPQAIVTLEVDNAQAKTLVAAQTQGNGGGNDLWFGLLGAKPPGDDGKAVVSSGTAG